MKRVSQFCISVFLLFIAVQISASSAVQESTEAGNLYASGADVKVTAPVNADLFAAGGHVSVEREVRADAAIAAGTVDVRAPIGQDLRAAGGKVNVDDSVGGELVAAGGTVRVGSSANVAGPARLTGGEVELAGRVGKGARIYASNIMLSGRIDGTTRLYGQEITLMPGAIINGDLFYASPDQLHKDQAAQVLGAIIREQAPPGRNGRNNGLRTLLLFHPVFVLSMLAAGMLLYMMFPDAIAGTRRAIEQYPLRSLLMGVALFFAVPPLAVLLMITVIGIPIGLVLLALYPVMLLLGYLAAAFFLGGRVAGAMRQPERFPPGRQALFLAVALVVLSLLALIPFFGGMIVSLALIVGIGGWAVWIQTRYFAHEAS